MAAWAGGNNTMRMTKTMKKVLLSVCSAVFGLMMGLLVFLGAPVSVKADEVETTTVMYCDGASIRLADDGKSGIRFHVRVTSNEEGTVALEGNTYSADEFKALTTGILVIPSDKLASGEELTIEGATNQYASGAKAANVTGEECVWNLKSDEDGYFYEATAYVYNIPESSYDRDFTFRGYYSLDGKNYVYTENANNERSVSYVALQAKIDDNTKKAEDETDGYQEGKLEILNSFLLGVNKNFKNVDKYLYRVGNQNSVSVASLFSAPTSLGEKIYQIIEDITCESDSVDMTLSEDKKTVQFTGTGVVKLTLSKTYCTEPTVLNLEVVDAVNATSATSAKSNNVVLLNDVGFSTLEVSGGYTLYGNGFKMTATNDIRYHSLKAAYVTLENGTLDNVQVICPNNSYSIIFKANMEESGNKHTQNPQVEDDYGNVRSAIMVQGNGVNRIINSYISGGRAGVYATAGDISIENTTIDGGAGANIHVVSPKSLLLKDTTLIQEPKQATVWDTSKTTMGFSVVVENDGKSVTPITLEGTFVQYAWANESYKQYVPSNGQTIINMALGKTDYNHTINGVKSINLGIVYMNPEGGSVATPVITDNRTDKATIPYSSVSVSPAIIYSYKNSNGTDAKMATKPAEYVPTAQSQESVLPTVSFNDARDGMTFETAYAADKGWHSTLTLDLDVTGDYDFSFSKLLAQKYGKTLSYTVTKDGASVDTSKTITLNDTGTHNYVLTITDATNVQHSYLFTIVTNKTSIEPPVKVAEPGGDALLVVKSKDSDWSCAIPALEGTQIKYYSKSEKKYVTLSLSSLTPTSKGKQNGTENYWQTACDDYSLKVSCGVIHDTKNVYGMPVVVDNSGYKMYFTISSTNGYVTTSTASRTVTISYEFTANGQTINFSKTWQFKYADYKSGTQYSYSDFVSGTLKAASGGCVTPDTLVTLADGTQKEIQYVTYNDMLLVWDFYKGEYTVMPSSIVMNHGYDTYKVVSLTFDDGTVVNTINGHGFFDKDTNEFVILSENNVEAYIGHAFVKEDVNKTTKLVSYSVREEYTESWSILTAGHYNCIMEGMLTITPAEVDGSAKYLMPFELGADMKYDVEAMQADIEMYGLYTYEDFAEYMTSEQYEALNLAIFKVSVAKGYITWEEILYLIGIHI